MSDAPMPWPWWEQVHTERLVALCREDDIDLDPSVIVDTARAYMDCGADGGGNDRGLVGTVIALNVDRVARAHHQERAR